ncbi:hypothetical protein RHMOL_Rhmol09G0074500 [Rhododendron molle]|uniref:Uncharacterized protein n=1 Tax=Rhododendron molle TaxID=49168 RepID=A0ACC0MAW2_RHOML|nr:hypothetical protein RHMOL_Rhmol09G0074500 [Rhododendron molle]
MFQRRRNIIAIVIVDPFPVAIFDPFTVAVIIVIVVVPFTIVVVIVIVVVHFRPFQQKKQEEEGKKEEEEDIKEVKEEEVKPKHLQYSIVSLLLDVKFNQVQSEQIQKSPFANMLFAITESNIDEQMVKKSDPILVKLIETYKRGQAKFLLAGNDIALTDLELGVIFGITSGPVKIHITTHGRRPDTKFANRVFAGESTMHLPTMRVTIENILKPPVKKKQKKEQKEVSKTEAAKDLACLLTLSKLDNGISAKTVYLPE